MKYTLLFVFSFLSLSALTAQNKQVAFVSDSEVEWLAKEVTTLETVIKDIKEDYETKDLKKISEHKTDIIKSVTRLSSNCNILCQKIELEINPTNRRTGGDTPKDYYYNKKKAIEAFQELNLTPGQITDLNENGQKMKEIKETLNVSRFDLHPEHPVSASNIDLMDEMLVLAKAMNKIIQESKTAE